MSSSPCAPPTNTRSRPSSGLLTKLFAVRPFQVPPPYVSATLRLTKVPLGPDSTIESEARNPVLKLLRPVPTCHLARLPSGSPLASTLHIPVSKLEPPRIPLLHRYSAQLLPLCPPLTPSQNSHHLACYPTLPFPVYPTPSSPQLLARSDFCRLQGRAIL